MLHCSRGGEDRITRSTVPSSSSTLTSRASPRLPTPCSPWRWASPLEHCSGESCRRSRRRSLSSSPSALSRRSTFARCSPCRSTFHPARAGVPRHSPGASSRTSSAQAASTSSTCPRAASGLFRAPSRGSSWSLRSHLRSLRTGWSPPVRPNGRYLDALRTPGGTRCSDGDLAVTAAPVACNRSLEVS